MHACLHVRGPVSPGLERVDANDLVLGQSQPERLARIAALELALGYPLGLKSEMPPRLREIVTDRGKFAPFDLRLRLVAVAKLPPPAQERRRDLRPGILRRIVGDVIAVTERLPAPPLCPPLLALGLDLVPVGIERRIEEDLRAVPGLEPLALIAAERPGEIIRGTPRLGRRRGQQRRKQHRGPGGRQTFAVIEVGHSAAPLAPWRPAPCSPCRTEKSDDRCAQMTLPGTTSCTCSCPNHGRHGASVSESPPRHQLNIAGYGREALFWTGARHCRGRQTRQTGEKRGRC